MSEWLPYLPLVTVLGPIIGALIGAAVTIFILVKRKKVTFYVYKSEDLTLELQQHLTLVVLRLNNQDVLNLNRARVSVANTGNETISSFRFDVLIPGAHRLAFADKKAKSAKLLQDIEIDWDKQGGVHNSLFTIKVPFLNKSEKFDIDLFFDGMTDDVKVACRMENVTCRIRDPDYINSNTMGAAILRGLLAGLGNQFPFGR